MIAIGMAALVLLLAFGGGVLVMRSSRHLAPTLLSLMGGLVLVSGAIYVAFTRVPDQHRILLLIIAVISFVGGILKGGIAQN